MKSRKYHQVHDGVWFKPTMKNHMEQCCDCGLIHKVEYRIVDGEIEYKAWRVKGETKEVRRRRRISVSKLDGRTKRELK